MEIYWIGKDNKEVLSVEREYFNVRIGLETQTSNKFVTSNKHQSYCMELFATVLNGQNQLFEFQNNPILLTYKYHSLLFWQT